MNNPQTLNLAGDRWVAFIRELPLINIDLTGATFAMQVRTRPDITGAPLVDLTTVVSAANEGVRLIEVVSDPVSDHITAGRLPSVPTGTNPNTGQAYTAADVVTLSLLGIRINETTMEGLPWPNERGDDAVLAWDLHITPAGETKDKFVGGTFTVRAGVTQ